MQALWVLGSAATLQRSPVWAALLEDAERRVKIVPDAVARCALTFKQCLSAVLFQVSLTGHKAPSMPVSCSVHGSAHTLCLGPESTHSAPGEGTLFCPAAVCSRT